MLEIGILRAVFFQIRNRSKTWNHPAGKACFGAVRWLRGPFMFLHTFIPLYRCYFNIEGLQKKKVIFCT